MKKVLFGCCLVALLVACAEKHPTIHSLAEKERLYTSALVENNSALRVQCDEEYKVWKELAAKGDKKAQEQVKEWQDAAQKALTKKIEAETKRIKEQDAQFKKEAAERMKEQFKK